MYVCMYIHIYIYIFICKHTKCCEGPDFECSGMWRFRVRGWRIVVSNPSTVSALGVKSPHLQFLRLNKL